MKHYIAPKIELFALALGDVITDSQPSSGENDTPILSISPNQNQSNGNF